MTKEELKQQYAAARSPSERRLVCLHAIDHGVVFRGGPVTDVDEIFGTKFSQTLPTASEGRRQDWILFSPQADSASAPDTSVRAIGFVGWYMALEYDTKGLVQSYYLSNIHKGMSARADGKESPPAELFKKDFALAETEDERRAVCLKAIDEGVIQTFGPLRVSVIDTIFGTRLASALPKKADRTKVAFVDFLSSTPVPRSDAPPQGWFLAVEYGYDGILDDYYVSNVPR